jgi:hypothetical protein
MTCLRDKVLGKSMHIEYTTQLWQERATAHWMLLDVVGSGRTMEEAIRTVDEAIRLFLLRAADTGSLNEALQEAGYKLNQ